MELHCIQLVSKVHVSWFRLDLEAFGDNVRQSIAIVVLWRNFRKIIYQYINKVVLKYLGQLQRKTMSTIKLLMKVVHSKIILSMLKQAINDHPGCQLNDYKPS